MKVNKSHHELAAGLVKVTATKAVRDKLISEGLTKAQAQGVVRWQRKKAGIWQKGSGRHFVNPISTVKISEPDKVK
jgi:hypothetical protein